MGKKIMRVFLTAVGMVVGIALVVTGNEIAHSLGFLGLQRLLPWAVALIYIIGALAVGIIAYIISPRVTEWITRQLHKAEERFQEMSMPAILFGVTGLVVGLLIAMLLSTLTSKIPFEWVGVLLSAALYVLLGYLGWSVGTKRRGEMNMPGFLKRGGKEKGKNPGIARAKILDTSVIIDGRIYDICKTGILEGIIIIPNFVLQELRHIADSSDALKRNRGRRGLDILNKMQQDLQDMTVRVEEKDYDDIQEVDMKLLRLAQELSGVVVTNDYNLNKVAAVQNVPVLNINDLSNAIKPALLPGEDIRLLIVKEGKEAGQGVGYLDDGTMVVVDGGKRLVGTETDASVTSVLQTAAGRMIFAKAKA